MAWDNRVDSGHELALLVADRMEIGVADTAEEDLDLYVMFARISTRDRRRGKRRSRTASRVSLRLVHGLMLLLVVFRPLIRPCIVRR